MNKFMKKAVILALTALVMFTSMPVTVAKAADSAPVHTSITTSKKGDDLKVTYKLTIDKTTVTDGRIAVIYDTDIFTLVKQSDGLRVSEKDINTEYVNGENKGISYAFVNDSPRSVSGTVLTLQFDVADGLEYQESVITTNVIGLNNEDTAVLTDEVLSDSVSVGQAPLNKPVVESADSTFLGVKVKWSKDENADGYIVYRSDSKNGTFTQVASVWGTSYSDIFVKNNKTYYYKVVSYQGSRKNRVYSEESNVVSVKVKKFDFSGLFR